MHLDDAAIQSLLIGESSPESEARAREHLATCEECGARWAAAEREAEAIAEIFQTLDSQRERPRNASLQELLDRAQSRVAPSVRSPALAAPGRSRYRWLQRAAAVVIALGLLRGAYAMPGSPLPKWVASMVERVTKPERPAPDPAPTTPDVAPTPPAPQVESGMSGIAVAPGSSLLVLFQQPAGEGEIQVTLVDGAEVQVRAPSGAATFTSGADRILIDHPTSAVFELAIPRSAPRVEIQVDGRRVFLKQGGQVTTATPAGVGGSYVLPLISTP